MVRASLGAVMDVQGKLAFVVDTGEVPVAATAGPSGQIEHRGRYDEHVVTLHDQRRAETSIDEEGFELAPHPTAVADFHDLATLPAAYYPEVKAIVRRVTGAQRVEVFDHTVRSGDPDEQDDKILREPLQIAHNDYTEKSGPARLRLALPDEADALLRGRFAIVQVWRPTHEPIRARPLALCDARTVRAADLLLTERRHRDRVGYIYNLLHHPAQRWCWFSEMTRDEALVFKVYDSDETRARFTPHGSAVLLDTPPDAPPRRSIEVRTIALF